MYAHTSTSRRTGILVAVAALAVLLVGNAFTAANNGTTTATVGYGTITVSGATVNSISYTINSTTDNVDSVDLVLNGDTTSQSVSMGLEGGARVACDAGTYDGSTETTYLCPGTGSFTQAASTLSSTEIAVTD